MSRIPLLLPSMPSVDALLPYLRRIDAQRQYTNFGPLSGEFERRLVAHAEPQTRTWHATTVANATIGLELALQASGLPPGARVLIPAVTFVATATAVLRAGMVPVIGDVDAAHWCLTPAIAEAACRDSRIDAVMPVATFGCSHEPAAWDDHIRCRGGAVIIDAAGAFGNQQPGALSDVVYSFHATKAFGAGEGGAVVSASAERVARIRKLSNFGIDTSCGELVEVGTNGKMSEYHCAVALASFDAWEKVCTARRTLYAQYLEQLRRRCPALTLQQKSESGIYPLMTVLLPAHVDAVRIADALDAAGIGTRRWYCPPLHQHAALRDQPRAGPLTVSERLGGRILGLPFFIGITEPQIGRVVDRLADALAAHGALA